MTLSTKYLGKQQQEAVDELDVVPSPASGVRVLLDCSEFTSHCPVTSQPDFASIGIDYIADENIVETKSLKLWLWRWRDRRAFNEAIVVEIARSFFDQVKPFEVSVRAQFAARGGISVSPSFTVKR